MVRAHGQRLETSITVINLSCTCLSMCSLLSNRTQKCDCSRSVFESRQACGYRYIHTYMVRMYLCTHIQVYAILLDRRAFSEVVSQLTSLLSLLSLSNFASRQSHWRFVNVGCVGRVVCVAMSIACISSLILQLQLSRLRTSPAPCSRF